MDLIIPVPGTSNTFEASGDHDFDDYVPVAGTSTPKKPVETVTIEDEDVEYIPHSDDEHEIIELSDEDDDEIREIFDESNRFTKFRPVENVEFISDNPDENADLNDPGWDTVRNLKDDAERRQFAIDSFGNWEPGDPLKNMTFYGFLRQKLQKEDEVST